jgi:hypothetical protein
MSEICHPSEQSSVSGKARSSMVPNLANVTITFSDQILWPKVMTRNTVMMQDPSTTPKFSLLQLTASHILATVSIQQFQFPDLVQEAQREEYPCDQTKQAMDI